MSAKYRRPMFNLAFLLVPVLASCGNNDGTGGGTLPAGLTLPECTDGQLLGASADGKTLVCVNAPIAKLDIPAPCDATTGALNSDGKALGCVTKASGNLDSMFTSQIDMYTKQVSDLSNTVTVLQGGGGATPVFVGTTKATTNAMVTDANGNVGVAAAANVCAAEFGAGAKMCTIYDMYNSVVRGKITPQMTVAKSWVYAANWKVPTAGATEALNGLSDNCAGFTYKTADQKWTGTSFLWEPVAYNGKFAPKFVSNTACGTVQPIACCR